MTAIPIPDDIGIRIVDFDLDPAASGREDVGGKIYVTQRGVRKWMIAFTTPQLERPEAQKFRAWWNGQKGGLNTMLVHHPEQPFPLQYANGFDGLTRAADGEPFTGLATCNALTPTSITVQGLPAGFSLVEGDFFGLVEGIGNDAKYGLFEIAADATANGGGVITLSPQPAISTTVFTTAAKVNFARALVEMKAVPDSWSNTRSIDLGAAKFKAKQVGY